MPTPKLVAEAERLGILPKTVISSSAEYRRHDYLFRREQSPATKACEWEGRTTKPEPWGKVIVEWIGFIACLFYIYLACWR